MNLTGLLEFMDLSKQYECVNDELVITKLVGIRTACK